MSLHSRRSLAAYNASQPTLALHLSNLVAGCYCPGHQITFTELTPDGHPRCIGKWLLFRQGDFCGCFDLTDLLVFPRRCYRVTLRTFFDCLVFLAFLVAIFLIFF